jgi:hypothetical protein
MAHTGPANLSRRNFLRSAVALAGASILSLDGLPGAEADAPAAAGAPATSLSFWAPRFVNPALIVPGGGLSTEPVSVCIHNHFVPGNTSGLFDVIQAHYAADGPSGTFDAPVFVWVANPPPKGSTFQMPVAAAYGIAFSVQLYQPQGATESYYLSIAPGRSTAKLHAGTYVLATGNPNWSQYRVVDDVVLGPGNGPAPFEYVLLTVTPTG